MLLIKKMKCINYSSTYYKVNDIIFVHVTSKDNMYKYFCLLRKITNFLWISCIRDPFANGDRKNQISGSQQKIMANT